MVRIQSFLFATTMALVLLLLGVAEVQGAAIRVDKNEPTSRSMKKKSSSSLPFSTKSLSPVRRSFVSRWFSIQSDPTDPTNNPALDSSSDSVEFSQSGSLNLLRSKKDELLDQAQVAAEEAEEEEHIGGRLAGGGGDDGDDDSGMVGRGGAGAASWWQRQRRRQRESKQWRMEDAKRGGKKRL